MQTFDPQNDYEDYLQTIHWTKTRKSAIDRAGNVCENCGVSGKRYILQCHHLTYKNKWNEQPEELIVLCTGCHKSAHNHLTISRKYRGNDKSGLNLLPIFLAFFLILGFVFIISFLIDVQYYPPELDLTVWKYLLIFVVIIAIAVISFHKRKGKTLPVKEEIFEPEEHNPYFHRDPETGNYVVTRWKKKMICKSRVAAEILSSDLSNDEVNRKLAELDS